MNKVMLVGRLTRDPELRSLPSGKAVATFSIATNEFRGGNGERTEYHACVAWDRLAEICGQFLSKGQLVDVEGRLQPHPAHETARRVVVTVPESIGALPPCGAVRHHVRSGDGKHAGHAGDAPVWGELDDISPGRRLPRVAAFL